MNNKTDQSYSLEEKILQLEHLHKLLQGQLTPKEKETILDANPLVKNALETLPAIHSLLKKLPLEARFLIKSVCAIGQAERVFSSADTQDKKAFTDLLQLLSEIEKAYDTIGGIIGYQLTVLKLIIKKQVSLCTEESAHYLHPPSIDLTQETSEVKDAIQWGLAAMTQIAEFYPVGGAGDRLDLHDEETKEPLPAAALKFCGRTLLEGLIRDLQAREYLYYKLFNKQLHTPIAMMTSHEKNNHQHILKICSDQHWFGRNKEKFLFFIQPLVPVVTFNGDWAMQGPLSVVVKPGGHGMIWKLAIDAGIFDQLLQQGFSHALVRQINNPIAGMDYGLCAFKGWGIHHKKLFGFASCPRRLNTSEGMDVLIESITNQGVDYRISNIEYTEFEACGFKDVAVEPGSEYSQFPANTNVLFVNLNEIQRAVGNHPIPGQLINIKATPRTKDAKENLSENEMIAGRLESTMQNISDYIVDHFPNKIDEITPLHLKTYVTYNHRRKTISVAKKSYVPNSSIHETPEGCFYELLQNYEELLKNHCNVQIPSVGSEEEYLNKGPAFFIHLHPALGPFYSIISKKIQDGHITKNSELYLEITELKLEKFRLTGSLIIKADDIIGKRDADEILKYSEDTGKCVLRDVTIVNKGIDWQAPNKFWTHRITRHESCQITLQGNAEFYAEGVSFEGHHNLFVPNQHRMIVDNYKGNQRYRIEKIDRPSWYWHYSFDAEKNVVLKQVS